MTEHATTTPPYCPAYRGHGIDVHECDESLSVVVPAALLRELRDSMWDSTAGSRFDNAVQALIDLAPEGNGREGER